MGHNGLAMAEVNSDIWIFVPFHKCPHNYYNLNLNCRLPCAWDCRWRKILRRIFAHAKCDVFCWAIRRRLADSKSRGFDASKGCTRRRVERRPSWPWLKSPPHCPGPLPSPEVYSCDVQCQRQSLPALIQSSLPIEPAAPSRIQTNSFSTIPMHPAARYISHDEFDALELIGNSIRLHILQCSYLVRKIRPQSVWWAGAMSFHDSSVFRSTSTVSRCVLADWIWVQSCEHRVDDVRKEEKRWNGLIIISANCVENCYVEILMVEMCDCGHCRFIRWRFYWLHENVTRY